MAQKFLLGLLAFYRNFLRFLKPPCCRFQPSCSEYARQALLRYGAWRGSLLSISRILRCQPFYHGPVYDPVPENPKELDHGKQRIP
ncbi:MAG: membrane protein insertion efficiency factor YidD [Oligosphaeraceae bacterium]|nr:membrane protein insertion efficiency factor YidD [Oligosphaeraceae bacterium]